MKRTLLALLLVGCGSVPGQTPRRTWTTGDFRARQAEAVSFGGWRPAQLVSPAGQVAALPGFSQGRAVAFAITEIWSDAPNPWVPPVYRNLGNPLANGIFPVGTAASFYSPFWRSNAYQWTGEPFTSAKQVLDRGGELTVGDVIVCPIVPDDTTVATVHPLTRAPLTPTGVARAWVEGEPVSYLAFGLDRAQGEGDRLEEAKLFVFVGADGGSLGLPAVLDDDAFHRSFARRYEVPLPAGARALWPADAGQPEGVAAEAWAPLEAAPGAVDLGPLLLRVASNPSCFGVDAGFPHTCVWLDSRAALEAALPESKRRATTTTLSATVLREVGP